jgi:hypothetical protein
MRIFITLSFVLNFVFQSFSQDSLSVLFIGNSYVYTFDLPTVLKNLAQSKGDIVAVASKTNGGYTFQSHVNDPLTFSKIHLTDWNYVVLQGQSQEASFPYDQVNTSSLPFAVQLADSVYANNECSQVMYFMTWGRQVGDPQWDSINTFDKMNQRLRDAYLRIAENANASVAAAGPAWKYVRDNYPTINLFSSDGSHPSFAGTYLNACMFYSSLFHKSPENASYVGTLDAATAQILQNVAKLTVLDSLSTWKLVHSDSLSSVNITYTFNQSAGSYQFTSNATHIENYTWDFGDGTVSTEVNPLHTFGNNGMFSVQLIGEGPCGNDTSTIEVQVSILGFNELKDVIQIQSIGLNSYRIIGEIIPESLTLTDLTGRRIPFVIEVMSNKEYLLKTEISGIKIMKLETKLGEIVKKLPFSFE